MRIVAVMAYLLAATVVTVGNDERVLRHQYLLSSAFESGYLVRVEGRETEVLFVGLPSASHDWTLRIEDGKMQLWCQGAQPDERKYLSFCEEKSKSDTDTKDDSRRNLVLLTTESKENSFWDIEIDSQTGRRLTFYLRARSGHYKGWYLSPGDAVDNLRTSNNPKVGFKAKAATISPDKKPFYRLSNGTDGK